MLHGGYRVLDVRSDREKAAYGSVKNAVHVPFTKDRRTIDNKISKTKVDGWIYKV